MSNTKTITDVICENRDKMINSAKNIYDTQKKGILLGFGVGALTLGPLPAGIVSFLAGVAIIGVSLIDIKLD